MSFYCNIKYDKINKIFKKYEKTIYIYIHIVRNTKCIPI